MPLILLNKPFHVLSQFTDADGRATLAGFIDDSSVYAAGRLDFESEGLLLLTDDGRLQARISQPRSKLAKNYRVQVEGEATEEQVRQLSSGVVLKDGFAKPKAVVAVAEPENLWPRVPPIRERRNIPTSWLSMTIDTGRNRQVRRMTAAVGLPALRLVRYSIGPWKLGDLRPGESRQITTKEAWRLLRS